MSDIDTITVSEEDKIVHVMKLCVDNVVYNLNSRDMMMTSVLVAIF